VTYPVIWANTDGREIYIYELLKIGYFPPGFHGNSSRQLVSPMSKRPVGTTFSVLDRNIVPNLTEAEWSNVPCGNGWTERTEE
jgi:hypothetical protein